MKLNKEKVKQAAAVCAYAAGVLAVLGFGFFAVYTDIKTPGTAGMSLAEIMQSVAEFRGGELTAEEMECARISASLIVGGFLLGGILSSIAFFAKKKYPENKFVRWLLMEPEEVESEEQK